MAHEKTMTVLCLGDLIGSPGTRAVLLTLSSLVKKHRADAVILNGENAAEGFGLLPDTAQKLLASGVHVITTGNHVWQNHAVFALLDQEERLLRPLNYPKGAPGHGSCQVSHGQWKYSVINLMGRSRMSTLNDPFVAAKEAVRKLKSFSPVVIIDFHAEDPEEKEALAWHLDGEASLVFGTHTHVQTADEKILPGGTGFISDIGMVGPRDSVIGFKPEISIARSLGQMPLKMEVSENSAIVQGIVAVIDVASGKTISLERLQADSIV